MDLLEANQVPMKMRKPSPFLFVTALSAAVAGCIDEGSEPTPLGPASTSAATEVPLIPDDQIVEDPFQLQLARAMPKFGGVYYDEEGRLEVAVTSVEEGPSIREAVRRALPQELAGSATPRTRVVEFSFLELARYRTLLRPEAFAIEGVVSIGVKESLNRVEIGVSMSQAADRVRLLSEAMGVPDGMLSIIDVPVPTLQAGSPPSSSIPSLATETLTNTGSLTSGYRVQVVGELPCTLGITAISKATLDSVFTTASHCTPITAGYDGENIGQPTSSWPAGTEVLDPPQYGCESGSFSCRLSDAAIFEENSSTRTLQLGKIARTIDNSDCDDCAASLVIDQSQPTFPIIGRRDYVLENERIDKVGMTTGWTYGAVEDTCTDVNWYTSFDRHCTDRIDYSSDPGDSGAPVFDLIGNSAKLVGVHWGYWPYPYSDALTSRIPGIEADIGVDLAVFDPGAPGASVSGPSSVGTGIQCTWTAVTSNGITPFTYSWSGLWSGSGSSLTKVATSSGWLYLTVTDLLGRSSGSYSFYVSVSPSGPTPAGCTE